MKLFEPIIDKMGALLGPREEAEIVITLYEDDTINFQVMGRKGPISPGKTYKLLACVAQEVAKDIQPDVQAITQEAQQ